MPHISVIMPVYNDARYVGGAVESILGQTFTDFEFIIINDGSTDATSEILGRYRDSRIRLVNQEQNLGVARSLNHGLVLARGTYIARQDSDDFSVSDRLKRQVRFLETHPDVAVVGCSAFVIDGGGSKIGVWSVEPEDIDLKWSLLFGCPFIHGAVMMRRSQIHEIGGYPEDSTFSYSEDYELWCRMAARCRFANLAEPLLKFRSNPQSISRQNSNEQVKQGMTVSRRTGLGYTVITDDVWSGIRAIFATAGGGPVNVNHTTVRDAAVAMHQLREAFYANNTFSTAEVARHRRKLERRWARRYLALAIKRNGKRDPLCRAELIRWAVRLCISSVSPEGGRVCTQRV